MKRSPPALRRALQAFLLLGLGLAGPVEARPGDVTAELDQIESELRTEFKHLREAASEIDDRETVAQMFDEYYGTILPEFLERFAAIARAHKGTDQAAEAWSRVVRQASSSSAPCAVASEALVALTTDHFEAESMGALCPYLQYGVEAMGEEPVVKVLEALGEKSPHTAVRAQALFSLAAVLGKDREPSDPRLERAREVFARLIANYPEEKAPDGRPCAEAARAFLFAMNHLGVGKPCPDFEAVDAEGASFNLSDYRGKVVLVDFWGFW